MPRFCFWNSDISAQQTDHLTVNYKLSKIFKKPKTNNNSIFQCLWNMKKVGKVLRGLKLWGSYDHEVSTLL